MTNELIYIELRRKNEMKKRQKSLETCKIYEGISVKQT